MQETRPERAVANLLEIALDLSPSNGDLCSQSTIGRTPHIQSQIDWA
jgi:hypothetical protein